jgi:cell shape-determining protein MreD
MAELTPAATGIDGQAGVCPLRFDTRPRLIFPVPVFIVLYLFLVGVAALLAQMELPVMFPVLDLVGISSALVPLVVIYASLELSDERAPILAAGLGLLLDLELAPPHRLGVSVLLLTSLSLLIITQAHKKESAHWITRLTWVLVGTFGYLSVDYLVGLLQQWRWDWSLVVWSKITLASLLNFIFSPLLFFLFGLPPRLCGWKPAREMRPRPYAR